MSRWIGAGVVLLLLGCAADESDLPPTQDQIVALLTDLHLAEGAVQELPMNERDSMLALYYDEVSRVHGTDRATVDTLLARIRDRPLLLTEIYSRVADSLEVRKATNVPSGRAQDDRPPED